MTAESTETGSGSVAQHSSLGQPHGEQLVKRTSFILLAVLVVVCPKPSQAGTTDTPGTYPLRYHAAENRANARSITSIGGVTYKAGGADGAGDSRAPALGTSDNSGKILLDALDTDPGAGKAAGVCGIDFAITAPTDDYLVTVVLENARYSTSNYLQGFRAGANMPGTGEWGVQLLDASANVLATLKLQGQGAGAGGQMVLTNGTDSITMTGAVDLYADTSRTQLYGVSTGTWLHGKGMRFSIIVKSSGRIIAVPRCEQAGFEFNSGSGAVYSEWHDSSATPMIARTQAPLGWNWYSATDPNHFNNPDKAVGGYSYINKAPGLVRKVRIYAKQAGTGGDGTTTGYRRTAAYLREIDVVSLQRASLVIGDSQMTRLEKWRRYNPTSANTILFMLDAMGMSFMHYSQAPQVQWWLGTAGFKRVIAMQGGHDTSDPNVFLRDLQLQAADWKRRGAQLTLCTLYRNIADANRDVGFQGVNENIRRVARENSLPLVDFYRQVYDDFGNVDSNSGERDSNVPRAWRSPWWTATDDRNAYAGETWDLLSEQWIDYTSAGEAIGSKP